MGDRLMANNKLTEQYIKDELAVLRSMYNNINHIAGPLYYADNNRDFNYYDPNGKIINIEEHTEIDVSKYDTLDKDGYKFITFKCKDKNICYMYNKKTDEFVADLSNSMADVSHISKIYKLNECRLLGIYKVEPYSYYGEEQRYRLLFVDIKSKQGLNIECTHKLNKDGIYDFFIS